MGNRVAQGLQHAPNDLSLLSNDAELALVQNDLERLKTRLQTAQPLLTPQQQESAILPFLNWLANPKQSWGPVLQAIAQLDPAVEFSWDFDDMQPAVERQNEKTQRAARAFIEFFQGKMNIEALKKYLAGL